MKKRISILAIVILLSGIASTVYFIHNRNIEEDNTNEELSIDMRSNRLETKYVGHEEIVFETIQNEVNFDDYYVLIIYDGGYSADFDIFAGCV